MPSWSQAQLSEFLSRDTTGESFYHKEGIQEKYEEQFAGIIGNQESSYNTWPQALLDAIADAGGVRRMNGVRDSVQQNALTSRLGEYIAGKHKHETYLEERKRKLNEALGCNPDDETGLTVESIDKMTMYLNPEHFPLEGRLSDQRGQFIYMVYWRVRRLWERNVKSEQASNAKMLQTMAAFIQNPQAVPLDGQDAVKGFEDNSPISALKAVPKELHLFAPLVAFDTHPHRAIGADTIWFWSSLNVPAGDGLALKEDRPLPPKVQDILQCYKKSFRTTPYVGGFAKMKKESITWRDVAEMSNPKALGVYLPMPVRVNLLAIKIQIETVIARFPGFELDDIDDSEWGFALANSATTATACYRIFHLLRRVGDISESDLKSVGDLSILNTNTVIFTSYDRSASQAIVQYGMHQGNHLDKKEDDTEEDEDSPAAVLAQSNKLCYACGGEHYSRNCPHKEAYTKFGLRMIKYNGGKLPEFILTKAQLDARRGNGGGGGGRKMSQGSSGSSKGKNKTKRKKAQSGSAGGKKPG